MKALFAATLFTILFLSGLVLWAFATGTPLSGEPVVMLGVDPAAHESDSVAYDSTEPVAEQGAEQVTLNVAPVVPAESNDALVEKSPYGLLPKRADDGRNVASVYAKAKVERFDLTPKIAILMTGLGLNHRLSDRAIGSLPAAVSLGFSSYGHDLNGLTKRAWQKGHELVLELPLEPFDYPLNDSGPKTLLVSSSQEDNLPRLYWSLGRFRGYFAVTNSLGGRFLSESQAVTPLFEELHRRGLVYFSDGRLGSEGLGKLAEQAGLGYARADIEIDRNAEQHAVAQALTELEILAKRSGMAVGVAGLHTVSIDQIARWASRLKAKGIELVPVSAVYKRQKKDL